MSTIPPNGDESSGHFARLLHSWVIAHQDARLQKSSPTAGNMEPIVHPPDAILKAYSDLLANAFVFLRCLSHSGAVARQEMHDLGYALHNISGLLVHYGFPLDDEKYREWYLRPFDKKWGHQGFGLEQFLESRLRLYAGVDL